MTDLRRFLVILPWFFVASFLGTEIAWSQQNCSQVLSVDPTLSVIEPILAQGFFSSEIYMGGRCGDNVARLAARIREAKVPMDQSEVLYLLYENRKTPPVPVRLKTAIQPTGQRGQNDWDFHVVLVHVDSLNHAVVLDLDVSPRPIEISKYFEQLLPRENAGTPFDTGDRKDHVMLRTISAPEYLSMYDQNISGDTTATLLRDEQDQSRPIISVNAYLTQRQFLP